MVLKSIKNVIKQALGRHYEPWVRNPYFALRIYTHSLIAELSQFKRGQTFLIVKPRELQLQLQAWSLRERWNPFLSIWAALVASRIRRLESRYRHYYQRYSDALRDLPTDLSPCSTLLLVSGSLNSGGSERQAVLTALGLEQRGLQSLKLAVVYLRSEAERFYQHKLEAAGLPVIEFNRDTSHDESDGLQPLLRTVNMLPFVLRDVADYVRTLMMLRPKMVHLWLDEVNIKGGFAAVAAGVPRIILSGRSFPPSNFRLYQAYMREGYCWLLKQPGVTLINNSAAGAGGYERWLGLRPGSVRVVHNGFDFDEKLLSSCRKCRVEYRRRNGIPLDAPLVGTVIRLSEEKRPLLWAEIAARIGKAVPEAHFLVVGDGPLRKELEARAARPDLAGRLHVVGTEKQVLEAIATMDLFLLTSRLEGLPNVLIEAQAIGVPVVTTRVGGAPEALDHKHTGWVLGSDKPERVAAEIVSLLKDQSWRDAAAKAGPEFVKNRFGLERMLDETVQLYQCPP